MCHFNAPDFTLIFSPLFLKKEEKKDTAAEIKLNLALEIISNVKHYKLVDGMLQKAAIQKISEIWIRQDLLVTWFFLSTIGKLLQFSLVSLLLHVLLCSKQFKHDKQITSVFTCLFAFACFVVFETIQV